MKMAYSPRNRLVSLIGCHFRAKNSKPIRHDLYKTTSSLWNCFPDSIRAGTTGRAKKMSLYSNYAIIKNHSCDVSN